MFSVSNYIISEKDILFKGKIATIYKGSLAQSNSIFSLNEPLTVFAIKRVDARYLRYCINEKQFLSQLKSYPSLFNEIIDIFKTHNHVYIVYPFYNKETLEKLILNEKAIIIEEIIDYISEIIDLFLILRTFGIIHRDLRPNNILIHNNKIKITGFYSAIHENGWENCPNIIASPLYMSPEFIKGLKLTPKTDVWSLGIIFYELLYKKFPWQEIFKNNNKNQNEMLKIIEEFNKNPQSIFKNDYNENKIYPDEIKNLILSMLKYNEKDRISFEELSNHTLFKSNKNRIKPPAQKTLIRSITSPESEEIKEKEIYPDFFRKETADMQDKTIKNPENTVQNIILPLFTSEILDRTIQVTPNLASMKNPSLMEDIRLNSFSSNKNSSVDLSFLASDYVEEIISSLHLKYIPIKQIQRGSLIKSGGQGHVFNAVYNKQDYAIKEIPNVSYEFLNKVLKEAHNLKKYENPRLIHIYGISYTKCPMDDNFVILYLLFELKEGDLQTFIDKKISNFSQKLKISYQIAQGIYHLHKHSTPLVHADLKPSNILIDDSMNAFITDLGISKEIKEKETTCSRAFTPGYAAPEQVFSQLKENKIDSKTDIWSLGLVYYYMFYEKKVTLEIYSETKEKKCLRIKEDLEEYMSLKELIEKMVVYESSNRIEIEDVIDNLKEIALMKGFALKSAQF